MEPDDAAGGTPRDEEWVFREEAARGWAVDAVRAVRSLVESTLGPTGMEKLVETHDPHGEPETVVTSDAGELLDAVHRGEGFNHPVAALFVDGVDSMQRGLGDGATTATLLAADLVERGADLVEEGVHPGTVAVGYAMASNRAGECLDELAAPVAADDVDRLRAVARTSMTADLPSDAREAYARGVAEAVTGLAAATDGDWLNTDDVSVRVSPAADHPRRIYRGQVVRRHPAQHEAGEESHAEFDWTPSVAGVLRDATVAVLEREIDVEETATAFGGAQESSVTFDSTAALSEYASAREAAVGAVADRLSDLGVDVLVAQPELDDDVVTALKSRGVAVIDYVQYPKSDVYRVARATGAQVVGHVDDLGPSKLGSAGRVVERRVGDEKWTYFDECGGAVFTLVASANTATGRAVTERLLDDAVEVTATAAMDGQVLPGAGAPAVAVARDLRRYARSVSGKEQLAVEAFADACESVVVALARNAGYDPLDALPALRSAHAAAGGDGPAPLGFDHATGDPFDALDAGVVEPRRVFSQAIETAVAASEQLLTLDSVLYPGVDLGPFSPEADHD